MKLGPVQLVGNHELDQRTCRVMEDKNTGLSSGVSDQRSLVSGIDRDTSSFGWDVKPLVPCVL